MLTQTMAEAGSPSCAQFSLQLHPSSAIQPFLTYAQSFLSKARYTLGFTQKLPSPEVLDLRLSEASLHETLTPPKHLSSVLPDLKGVPRASL